MKTGDSPTPATAVREFRTYVGREATEIAAALGIADDVLANYEAHGGPAWLRYALLGLALSAYHLPADEVCRLLGAEPLS